MTNRQMRYFAKAEMFRPAFFARIISAMGAIPVHREAPDRQALKTCLDVLNAGWPIVLFPEGGRKEGLTVEEIQEGAVYLAAKTGAPIVPVGIAGSDAVNPKGSSRIRFGKVTAIIGAPMHVSPSEEGGRMSRSDIRDTTENLRQQLQQLLDKAESAPS